MCRVDLLDEFLVAAGNGEPDVAHAAAELATAMVATALDQAGGLRALDGFLYADPDAGVARRIALSLHDTWRVWASDAGALLDRIPRLIALGRPIARDEELADAYGRAMAMLQVTIEKFDRAREQARRGEVYSVEEVRRELRLGVHR